jgi:hypothetical protein
VSLLAADTREDTPIGGRRWEAQQFPERRRARLVHCGAHGHLDGLQIEAARLAEGAEDDAQQLVYFAGDFLLDRFGRFFSWASSSSASTGRKRQILAFTSTNS